MYERFFNKLQISLERLGNLRVQQQLLAPQIVREGTNTEVLRQRLRHEYMIPLARIGRRLFAFAPAIERTLKVPHARASHRELVKTAEAMLKAVVPQRKLLTSAGFSKTFLTEFRDLTRELKRIATTSSARRAKFARVSKKLREELASANETLRILEGLLLARMDRDKIFATSWKDALREPKPRGRPRGKTRKPAPNAAPVPASVKDTVTA
jgi:hypothetical protein